MSDVIPLLVMTGILFIPIFGVCIILIVVRIIGGK